MPATDVWNSTTPRCAAALTDQTSAVADLLGRSGATTSSSASFVSATDATVAGSYAINVTSASAPAALTGTAFSALGASETLNIRLGAATANVTLAAGISAADAVMTLNNALTAGHVNAHASLSGGALRVESIDHGSGTVLGITSSVGAGVDATGLGAAAGVESTAAGIDVVGTIDGQAATGVGQLLSATTGPAKGLTVRIGLGATGALGSVSYAGGVTGAVSTMLGASGIATVALADSISSISASKVAYNAQIDRMQERITNTEARLRRQFTQLETSLAQLRSQGSRLSAILGTSSSSSSSG